MDINIYRGDVLKLVPLIIEILPKLFISDNLPNDPLAVPYICKNIKTLRMLQS